MKKIVLSFLLIAVFYGNTFAADTITLGDAAFCGSKSYWCVKYTITWIDETGDGIAATDIALSTDFYGWYIFMATTDPGATAPTDNYDPVISKKTNGVDVFQGNLANRDTSTTESAWPGSGYEVLDDTLRFALSGNTQAGGQGTLTIYLVK